MRPNHPGRAAWYNAYSKIREDDGAEYPVIALPSMTSEVGQFGFVFRRQEALTEGLGTS